MENQYTEDIWALLPPFLKRNTSTVQRDGRVMFMLIDSIGKSIGDFREDTLNKLRRETLPQTASKEGRVLLGKKTGQLPFDTDLNKVVGTGTVTVSGLNVIGNGVILSDVFKKHDSLFITISGTEEERVIKKADHLGILLYTKFSQNVTNSAYIYIK